MISDTHQKWNKLVIPDCDLLISAGDYSFRGELNVVKTFHEWLDKQPSKHVVSVQGNHEVIVQKDFQQAKLIATEACPRVHFVEHEALEIDGIKMFFSAYTPFFNNWAYNLYDWEDQLGAKWAQIPEDTVVLGTHGPPYNILDIVYEVDGVTPIEKVGSITLSDRIKELKQLKLHCFGHIHCSAGEAYHNGVKYINASICDEMYMPTNPVREFELWV